MYLKSYISRPGRRASAVAALFGAIALPTALTAQPIASHDVTGWAFDLPGNQGWTIGAPATANPVISGPAAVSNGDSATHLAWSATFPEVELDIGESIRLTAGIELQDAWVGWNFFRLGLIGGTWDNADGGYALFVPTGGAPGPIRSPQGGTFYSGSAGYLVAEPPTNDPGNLDAGQGVVALTVTVRRMSADQNRIQYSFVSPNEGGYSWSGTVFDNDANVVDNDTYNRVTFALLGDNTTGINFTNVQVQHLPVPTPPPPPDDEDDADIYVINTFTGDLEGWTNNGLPNIFSVAVSDDDRLAVSVEGNSLEASGFRRPARVTLTGADFDAIKDAAEGELDAVLRFEVFFPEDVDYDGPVSISLRVDAPGSSNRTNFGGIIDLDEWPETEGPYTASAPIKGLNIADGADELTLYLGISTDWGSSDVDYTVEIDNVRVVVFPVPVVPPLEGTGANAWGFEGTFNGGTRLVNTGNGVATLQRITPLSTNAGDIRLRAGLEEPVEIESGDTAVFFGQFTLGTTARQGETMIEAFESLTVGTGEDTEMRFVVDPETTILGLDTDEKVEGSASLLVGHDGSVTITRNANLDLTGKSHLIIRYNVESAGDVDVELIIANTFNNNAETWHIDAELTADGEWHELIIPVDALELNGLGGNSLAVVGRTLNAVSSWTLDVVDSDGAGEFHLDFFTAAESLDDAAVRLEGVETRFALINTQGNGGTLSGTGWVNAENAPLALGNASGYMTVIRTGGDVNWAGGVPGVLGAVVNSNWLSTFGNNVGLGGGNQNIIEEEPEEEGGTPPIRFAQALAGTYDFEIRVHNLWDSRSIISYKIEGGADGYVLEGSEFMDRGVRPDGTVAATVFDAVGFRFNNSPFTTVVFSGVQVATIEGDAIDPWTLFTFDTDEEGWIAHEGDNAELDWVDGQLEITPASGGFLWSARADMPVKSVRYEAIRDAKSMNTDLAPLGITFDVTLDPARSGGYDGWFQIFVALQSGDNWNQYDQVIDVSWPVAAEEGEDAPQTTFKATLPLGRFNLDEAGESINLILGVNSGITDEEYSILVDNFVIEQLEPTAANTRAAAGAFFGVTVGADFLAATPVGWYYCQYFPWVFSYSLADVRPGNVNGWLYAYALGGATFENGAWFWDHGVQEWWLSATAVYPWAYSTATSDWVNIHVYPFQN